MVKLVDELCENPLHLVSEGCGKNYWYVQSRATLLTAIARLDADRTRLDWLEAQRDWNLALQECGITADWLRGDQRFKVWTADHDTEHGSLREAIDRARAAMSGGTEP
jgi:hypothetical protein